MHGFENADPLAHLAAKRSIHDIRQAIGESWPPHENTPMPIMSTYLTASAPQGGETYTAKNLGLT